MRRPGDLESGWPPRDAEVDEPCDISLLPARGTGQEPRAAADRRHVPPGAHRAAAGNTFECRLGWRATFISSSICYYSGNRPDALRLYPYRVVGVRDAPTTRPFHRLRRRARRAAGARQCLRRPGGSGRARRRHAHSPAAAPGALSTDRSPGFGRAARHVAGRGVGPVGSSAAGFLTPGRPGHARGRRQPRSGESRHAARRPGRAECTRDHGARVVAADAACLATRGGARADHRAGARRHARRRSRVARARRRRRATGDHTLDRCGTTGHHNGRRGGYRGLVDFSPPHRGAGTTRALGFCCLALVVSGCRASAIPDAQRYPAGTPFRAQYRTIDGTRLRLIDTGNGTPVVLIHGFGASMYGWRYQLPPLVAAGYRVVVIDNRGFGFSDKPAHGYTNPAYAHLVVSLLDSLGIASAVLVGRSMGGAIAAEVALNYPDRVRGMVLLDAAGYGVRWPGVLKLARWPQVGAVVTRFRARWITARILR